MLRKGATVLLPAASVIIIWLAFAYFLYEFSRGSEAVDEIVSNRLRSVSFVGASFGILSAIMASLAAAVAFITYSRQRRETELVEFDRNFFSLLDNFNSIRGEISIRNTNPLQHEVLEGWLSEATLSLFGELRSELKGRPAIQGFLYMIRDIVGVERYADSKSVHKEYMYIVTVMQNDLGHYFRTLYHIMKFIDDRCPGDKSRYAKIVRSYLSNSEICLLAYNCSVGYGRPKFKSLVVKYALLHNIMREGLGPRQAEELQFFLRMYPSGAFDFEEIPPFSYDETCE